MWSILENVLCILEKKVYSEFGWKVLKISIMSIWSNVSFKVCASLEKAMAHHSSTLAWRIPWTGEPGGLQSMGSLRVGQD